VVAVIRCHNDLPLGTNCYWHFARGLPSLPRWVYARTATEAKGFVMHLLRSIAFTILCLTACPALAQPVPDLAPYPLPAKTAAALADLAGQTDVLILGETHGMQEVPQIAAALLEPLSKLGYGILALEIPADQQQPLIDWATGQTTTVPPFFAEKSEDGRGNLQLLGLVRAAISRPQPWKLICFDEAWPTDFPATPTEEADQNPTIRKQRHGLFSQLARAVKSNLAAITQPLQPGDFIAQANQRDATMADTLVRQRERINPRERVLAICGNMHARTSNQCRPESPNRFPPDETLDKLWPSFAAALKIKHDDWRVRSVNVVAQSGTYFAAVSTNDGPAEAAVQTIRGNPKNKEATAHPLSDEYWDWQLDLPRATAATFLAAHSDSPPNVENVALREELLKRAKEDQAIRNELIAHGIEKPNEEVLARMKQIDADNQARLKTIVQQHGWPTASLVGKDAVHDAFLLVQHASDTAFQKEMLPSIEKSYKSGDLNGESYALLADRVRVREGQKQLYGTQARPTEEWKDKQPSLLPIDDEANVEQRRADLGLPPLAAYLKMLKQVYFPEPNTR
jgi:hypothetical protein